MKKRRESGKYPDRTSGMLPHTPFEGSKVLNFRVNDKLHAKLKAVASSSRKTLTGLLTDIIEKHIDDYLENSLADQLKQIPPEKRRLLLDRVEAEEKERMEREGG